MRCDSFSIGNAITVIEQKKADLPFKESQPSREKNKQLPLGKLLAKIVTRIRKCRLAPCACRERLHTLKKD